MASNTGTQKKRGRPATGETPHVTARLPRDLIDKLEARAKAEGKARSEVIRDAVEKHLK